MEKSKKNNHNVEVVEVGRSGLGHYLCYEIDGKQFDVTGEFFIDEDNILHHTHETPEGEEIEILYQL